MSPRSSVQCCLGCHAFACLDNYGGPFAVCRRHFRNRLCQAVNALRGSLAELGIVAAKGLAKGETLIEIADQVEALTERVDTLVRLDLSFV